MDLTPDLIQKIKDIVEKHHSVFIADVFGPEHIDPAVLAELEEAGLLEGHDDVFEIAYTYGQMQAKLEDPAMSSWSLEKVQAELLKNPIPLSAAEKHAVQTAKIKGALYVTGLGNTVNKETGELMVEADHALRIATRKVIQTETARSVAERTGVKTLKSKLGHATGDWARNLDRIAITEKHNVMQEGVADGYRKDYGEDVRVFIRAMPDACKHCKRLHIGPDGAPRIFKLSDLAPPGTNVGQKAANWVAVNGSVHPHCQCQISRVPVGWGFDEEGTLVPGGELGLEYDSPEHVDKSMQVEELHMGLLEKAYRLDGELDFQGLDVAIENGSGGLRFWKDRHDASGMSMMLWPYGYIRRTMGVDGDHVDCFVGPNPLAPDAYVVHQRSKTLTGFGGFDEHKCLLGFSSATEAKAAYLAHYDDDGFFGGMEAMPMPEFKVWVYDKSRTTRKDSKFVKSLAYAGGGHAEVPRDISDPPPRLEKGGSLLTIPLDLAWQGRVQPTTGERLVDCRVGDVHRARDGVVGGSVRAERQGNFQIPQTQSHVQPAVVGLVHHLKVGGVVVKSVPVDVVDDFVRAQSSPQHALHDDAMLKALAAVHVDEPVLSGAPERADMPAFVLRHGAEDNQASSETQIAKAGPHKYTSKKKVGDHWVYTYAEEHGGKVRPHKTDDTKMMLKLPKAQAAAVEKLATKYGLDKPVVGDKYVMLAVEAPPPKKTKKAVTYTAPKSQPVTYTKESIKLPTKNTAKPSAAAGAFNATELATKVAAATGMSTDEIRSALTSTANPMSKGGSVAAANRARLEHALYAGNLGRPDAIKEVLEHGGHDTAATTATLKPIVKGDLKRAVKEYGRTPSYDLEVLSEVKLVKGEMQGRAVCFMGPRKLAMGHGPKGDWVTGDFRHELGHAVHAALKSSSEVDAVFKAHFADVKQRRKDNPASGAGKMDSNWYEEKWGVMGKRGADDYHEDVAEHYRCYHRTLHQEQEGSGAKGSTSLAQYRERHPEMARMFDARYTAALMGLAAKKGDW